tara:strand:- start:32 stop:250 length:219 start_codon:yes stop_codon:yes gene_type:complete
MKPPLGASYFDSAFPVGSQGRKEADAYWSFPFCECDDAGETPDGKPGWICEGCGREIAVTVNPVCDFKQEER